MAFLFLTVTLLCVVSAQAVTELADSEVVSSRTGGGVASEFRFNTGGTSSTFTRTTIEPPSEFSPKPFRSPSPSPPPAYPVDFSTVESSLRTTIFQGDVQGAADVLRSMRIISLGAGLTYPERLEDLVDQSSDRNQDPDVVAFKALATNALETCNASPLARAIVRSFRPDCQCATFDSAVADDLIEEFTVDFNNKQELQEIIAADANTDLVPDIGRRLLAAGKSPVNSFACAYCWPKKQCRKMHWC